jgi:hypothetical protein
LRQAVRSAGTALATPDRGVQRPDEGPHTVLRLIRLLPLIIPVLTWASHNPKVRELLHLKPEAPRGRAGRGRSTRRR